jgi:hypothetical protein
MKKLIFIVGIVLANAMTVYSQSSYVRLNVGYGMPVGSQQLGTNFYYNGTDQGSTVSLEGEYGSYGSGVYLNAAYGLNLNGILGLDFEVGYQMGKEYKYGYYDTYEGSDYSEYYSLIFARKVSGLTFAPSITFTSNEGTVAPYTRIGPVFGMFKANHTIEMNDAEFEDGINIYSSKMVIDVEYTGGISIGVKGTLGVLFNPSGKIQFFTEASFVNMHYSPQEGKIIRAIQDGEDISDDIPSEFKQFKFKDKMSDEDFSEGYEAGVGNQLKLRMPLNALTLQAGIRISL